MAATKPLFMLPIIPSPTSDSIGKIECTTPSLNVYLLTFTSPPDNRLLTCFCQVLLLALDIIEFSHPPGVVITTSGLPKFYSNGLDLEHARSTKGFFSDSLYAVFKRFLTYPMPTIALVNGHAFAGGFMLAMYHDYRIFNPSRGFLCVNELEFGVPLLPPMSSIFRQKLDPSIYRTVVLEAHRWNGKQALDAKIVDGLGGMEEALGFVEARKLTGKGKTGVYGALKREMYKETMAYIDEADSNIQLGSSQGDEEVRRKEDGERRVNDWKNSALSPKL
ncbi:ClpP/crotonase-like domain-containing protein [Amylocarpus encephaloides]|uniref:ClpP/crotonase-like domain-containing protein n=1 Tax=Amylocarpus encephaloides TaxID=45428 RepID=A0A9P7YB21_9HELO|nr:ClpP/crotonase-like domain-containing protein [Amylocarpus encephaloides]